MADAIDIVRDQDGADEPKSSGHAQSTAHAYMMDASDTFGAPVGEGGARRLYHEKLPTVDHTTDSRVFAMLDEGCNMSCHGAGWIRRAIESFEAHGSHKAVSESSTRVR